MLASVHRLSSYIIGVYFGTCFSRVRFLVVLKENVNYYVLPFPSYHSDLNVDTISLRCARDQIGRRWKRTTMITMTDTNERQQRSGNSPEPLRVAPGCIGDLSLRA